MDSRERRRGESAGAPRIDRLFVYGAWCAILDAESGAVRWSFEAERVRRTRVELREKEREPLSLLLGGFGFSAPPPSNPGEDLLDYTRRGASQQTSPRLVAPAVDWAARLDPLRARTGWVLGSRLVLAREDVSIVDLELPLFPRRVQLAGSYLGSYGELLCLAEAGGLHVLDLQLRACELGRLLGQPRCGCVALAVELSGAETGAGLQRERDDRRGAGAPVVVDPQEIAGHGGPGAGPVGGPLG